MKKIKCDPAYVLKENRGRVHFYLEKSPVCVCEEGPDLRNERVGKEHVDEKADSEVLFMHNALTNKHLTVSTTY